MRFRQTRMWQDTNSKSMFGVLERLQRGIWEREAVSLEREWQDNRPSVSCVPCDTYQLVPHSGAKYKDTLALVGASVSYMPMAGVPRNVCVLHKADRGMDLQGCIAWGEDVFQSAFAARLNGFSYGARLIAEALEAYQSGETVLLTIRNAPGFDPK